MENHTLSSTVKNNPASSLSSPSHITKGMNNASALMSQEFLGFSTNEPDCPYSEIYPIIFPQNEDDYFADNALMDMYKDAPLIEDYCDARQVAIKNVSVESVQLMCEPHSVTTNTKTTVNYDHNYSQVQSSSTLPEVFSHSQKLNLQLSSPIVLEPRRSQENSQDQEHRECNNTQQGEMDSNAPISRDLPSSLNSEARVTNELGSTYSQIDFSSSANEDYDYFAHNAPLIEQIRSQENSQKDHQDYCDTHQVSINNNGGVGSEHLMSEHDSVITVTQTTQTYENDKYSQVQSWPTPETFGRLLNPTYERFVFKDPIIVQPRRSLEHYQKEDPVHSIARQVMINTDVVKSEQFKSEPYSTDTKLFGLSQVNIRLSRPANKRQKTSGVNHCNYNNIINMAFSPNYNFNVNQGIPSSVKRTTRGCKCRKSSCSNGRCPCFQAKVGCSRETCGCQGCENTHGTNRQLPNDTVRIMNNQRTIFHELPPQPTDPLQSRPSSCSRVHPTQRASVHELLQPTPLQQFRPSPCSSVNSTQRASSVNELPQPTPLQQFRPSPGSVVHPTQSASVHELSQQTPLQFHPH